MFNEFKNRNSLALAVIAGAITMSVYFGFQPQKTSGQAADPAPREFSEHDCTEGCPEQEAGFSWAEAHDIKEEGGCDTAAENLKSSAFLEGCRAYAWTVNPTKRIRQIGDDDN